MDREAAGALSPLSTHPVGQVEWLDRDGHVIRAQPVWRWPVTLGRDLACDVVLDDLHTAPRHARLDASDEGVRLTVCESVNGALVGSRHLRAGEDLLLPPGQVWRLGTTRLRVRHAAEPLPAERPLAGHLLRDWAHAAQPASGGWGTVAAWGALLLAWVLGEQWLDGDASTPLTQYLTAALTAVAAIGVWGFLWALGSKLFRGRLQMGAHVTTALRHLLLWSVLGALMPLLAYVTGWPLLSRLSTTVGAAVLCAMLFAHLVLILPGHRRLVGAGLAGVFATWVGLGFWLNDQRLGRGFEELYVTALPPPALRLAPTHPEATLIEDAQGLKPLLDRQLRDADDESEPEAGAAEDDGGEEG